MDWSTALLVLAVLLVLVVPPILLARLFQWARNKWRPGGKRRSILVHGLAFVGWICVLAIGAAPLLLLRSASVPPISRGPPASAAVGLPEFPWPPPAASSFAVIPLRKLLVSTRSAGPDPSFEHANVLLRRALAEAGQSEVSYYAVPDGFALVSRLEQIEEDGSPKTEPARWETRLKDIGTFSLAAYVRALFLAPPGYYRLVVFIVTPHPFTQASQPISRETAESWLRFGGNVLPVEIGLQPYTEQVVCTALIYEFEKRDTTGDPVLRLPGRLSAATHLAKSGIGRHLP